MARYFDVHPVDPQPRAIGQVVDLLREDGLLEFRGRLAHRLTVRGRTVDPYRAEAALAAHPGVREAVITAVPAGGGGQKQERLVAYVVAPSQETAPGVSAIARHGAALPTPPVNRFGHAPSRVAT